jgi:drug/metabolite transporter (DMT)-like permease
VIGILGGTTAAVMWASSTLAASRSTRILGSQQALAYVMSIGLVLCTALALASGPPEHLDAGTLAWAGLSAITSVGGLSFTYRALRVGSIGIVSPIVATEGGLAALVAVGLGESIGLAVAAALLVMVLGVVVVTYRPSARGIPPAALGWALLAAATFAVGLVASSHAGRGLGPFWTILGARVVGIVVVVIPLYASRRLPRPGRAWPFVTISGFAEVIGFTGFILGSNHSVAVPAVIASQFAALAVLGSVILFGERMSRRQVVGIAAILAGVAAVTVLQA